MQILITLQMLQDVGTDEEKRINFVAHVIESHKASDDYKYALIAQDYDRRRNTTITNYRKLLYTISGDAVPDNYSANYKLASNFFNRLVTQQNQYLLGKGVKFNNEATKGKLGDDFDTRLQEAGHFALVDKVSFGFWNLDRLQVFRFTQFAPIWDEINGALSAGVRFWQIDSTKPLRATLYEIDGYTDYIWQDGKGEILHPKTPYKLKVRGSEIDGDEIYDGENYPAFPIVPLWANRQKQSELVGVRESIDCYDLIKSGFANDIDDASLIYWTISNAGGMDDLDLAKFVKRIKTVKAAAIEDDGARAEAHTLEVPYNSREALLERISADIYDDFMGLDYRRIAGGAVTATQIKANYEPMNLKSSQYEYCVIDFVQGILAIAGIDDTPIFETSPLVNTSEEIQVILQAAQFLPQNYVTEKILTLLGDVDKVSDILKQMEEEQAERMERMEMISSGGSGTQEDEQETEET